MLYRDQNIMLVKSPTKTPQKKIKCSYTQVEVLVPKKKVKILLENCESPS